MDEGWWVMSEWMAEWVDGWVDGLGEFGGMSRTELDGEVNIDRVPRAHATVRTHAVISDP